ncbi:Glycoside hydrolase, family 35 [Cordyceps fumosorosea ARSEF 2679]|uniref:Beta-galactosidase n=1 Tax=Cordyceps fumosorosea (strain ARSEF 2679) TaxID=1081104 RepID=A0A168EH73_CORFA|nr:Glycoside hydrolase, family 35 [Cordyceps fumosorosea ARSEF 2679]OAA73800.1 Glycoside hydrolase, family 35 [Cordyceps fumosorosea ARSEF 2679]
MRFLWGALAAFSALSLTAAAPGAAHPAGNFSYNRHQFLLDGEPYQIIGGQMDPQRIPPEFWSHRLKMARAMGLNTIFSYLYWNLHEPRSGTWDFSGRNDVASFFRLAQAEGLKVVLRPGPYICGERDWGGFPAWLSQVPGMAVRQDNSPFLNAAGAYLDKLGKELGGLQVTHGGPILMTQLENEYGSFGTDKTYLSKLAAALRRNFDVPLYTNDGGGKSYLEGGQLHGVLAVIDGDSQSGFAARDKYVTDPTSLGPQLNGEYYITWIDQWGSDYGHQQISGSTDAISKAVADLDWTLAGNYSFSIYMFHGGTNFGFENGGMRDDGPLAAVTTSYDYGAPLDESGRPTDLYHALREMISKYVPAGSIPEIPAMPALAAVPEFALTPAAALFDVDGARTAARVEADPVSMDALGQSYGYVLYEHTVAADVAGKLAIGDGARDRAIVYVNGARVGVVDTIYTTPATVSITLKKGDTLQILVENLGRVDVRQRLKEQVKGIVGNVSVGCSLLTSWASRSIPLATLPSKLGAGHKVKQNDSPVFYTGSFDLPKGAAAGDPSSDTFISVPGGVKGVLWVNGVNLGRYWTIGPQQSLYVPGSMLKASKNEVVLLELEPQPDVKLTAEGIAERKWFNNADPDAPK